MRKGAGEEGVGEGGFGEWFSGFSNDRDALRGAKGFVAAVFRLANRPKSDTHFCAAVCV